MTAIVPITYLAIIILQIVAFWKVFEKANHPGWACLIPFYNLYILLQIAGKPGWWLLLMFVPLINVVINIITNVEIAKNFGKETGFGIGLTFLSFIFFPILAFSDAEYVG